MLRRLSLSFNIISKSLFVLSLPFIIMSCSGGASESEIAKAITLTVTKNALVLPNDLSDVTNQTCIAGGISGPRVRMTASLKWEGTQGDLLPMVIKINANSDNLTSEFNGTISPSGEDMESLAIMFGLATDYIPSGSTTHVTTSCFLDFGGLSEPVTELTGANTLTVPVTITMFGIVRDSNGAETPFIKEVDSTIVYVAGSIPID